MPALRLTILSTDVVILSKVWWFLLRMTRNFQIRPHIETMNRREFTKGAAALGVMPALPAPMVAAAANPPAAANFTPFMYAWAENHVRSGAATCSGTLARTLQVRPELAEAIYARLMRRGVVAAPGVTATMRQHQKSPLTPSRGSKPPRPVKQLLAEDDAPAAKADIDDLAPEEGENP